MQNLHAHTPLHAQDSAENEYLLTDTKYSTKIKRSKDMNQSEFGLSLSQPHKRCEKAVIFCKSLCFFQQQILL